MSDLGPIGDLIKRLVVDTIRDEGASVNEEEIEHIIETHIDNGGIENAITKFADNGGLNSHLETVVQEELEGYSTREMLREMVQEEMGELNAPSETMREIVKEELEAFKETFKRRFIILVDEVVAAALLKLLSLDKPENTNDQ